MLKLFPGATYVADWTWVQTKACGAPGEPGYQPQLLFDLSGSTVTLQFVAPGLDITIPLTLALAEESPGVFKLSKTPINVPASTTTLIPEGTKYYFWRDAPGVREPLDSGEVVYG